MVKLLSRTKKRCYFSTRRRLKTPRSQPTRHSHDPVLPVEFPRSSSPFPVSGSMSFILHPWQLFFLILSGWINRQQQEIIDFQNAQIRALMDKMGSEEDPVWSKNSAEPGNAAICVADNDARS